MTAKAAKRETTSEPAPGARSRETGQRRTRRKALGSLVWGALETVELWVDRGLVVLTGDRGQRGAVPALYNGKPNPGRYAVVRDSTGGWFRTEYTGGRSNGRGHIASWPLPKGLSLSRVDGYEFRVRRGSPTGMPPLVAMQPGTHLGFVPRADGYTEPATNKRAQPLPKADPGRAGGAPFDAREPAAQKPPVAVDGEQVAKPPSGAQPPGDSLAGGEAATTGGEPASGTSPAGAPAPAGESAADASLTIPSPVEVEPRFGVIEGDRGQAHADATQQRIRGRARAQRTHEPQQTKLQTAEDAATYPPYESTSRAQGTTVDDVEASGKQVARVDPALPKRTLETAVDNATPKSIGDLDKFSKRGGKIEEVKAVVQGSVTTQTQGMRTTFAKIDAVGKGTPLDRPKEGDLPPPESAPGSRAIVANKVLPPTVPDPALDATEFKVQADSVLTPLEITPKVLEVAQGEPDHPMAALAANRQALEDSADTSAPTARTTETQVLTDATTELDADESSANSDMRGARRTRMGKTQSRMQTRKTGAESEHKTFADKVRDIYVEAKRQVNEKLTGLVKVVGADFDEEQQGYLQTFKDGVDADMKDFKKRRYSSYWGKTYRKARDWVKGINGLSDVKKFYAKNRKTYTDAVKGLIDRTNTTINDTITSCRSILEQATKDVKTEYDNLTTKEKAGAKETLDGVLKQLQALEHRVSEREKVLKDRVDTKRTRAIDAVDAELDRIKKANQGFVNDVWDGAKAVANAIAQFARLVSRVSMRGVGTFVSDLLGQAWDGIKNYLWGAIAIELKDWLAAKILPITALLDLPKNFLDILESAGDTLLSFFLDTLPSALKGVATAFLTWLGEQAVRKLVPGAGTVGAVIDFLKAAWALVKRVLAAAGRFFSWLMEVALGKNVPQIFATALAKGLMAALEAVLVFFGVDKLIRRIGRAVAGPFKRRFGPVARKYKQRLRRDERKRKREQRKRDREDKRLAREDKRRERRTGTGATTDRRERRRERSDERSKRADRRQQRADRRRERQAERQRKRQAKADAKRRHKHDSQRRKDERRGDPKDDAQKRRTAKQRKEHQTHQRIASDIASALKNAETGRGTDYSSVRRSLESRATRLERRHRRRVRRGTRLHIDFEPAAKDKKDQDIDMRVVVGRVVKRLRRAVTTGDVVRRFSLAGKAHRLIVQRGDRVRVFMASQRDRVVGKYERYRKTIEGYRQLLEGLSPTIRDDVQEWFGLLDELMSDQIDNYAKQMESKTSKERLQVLENAEADADKLIQEIVAATGRHGLHDMTPEAVEKRMEEERARVWKAKQAEVKEALEGHVGGIEALEQQLRAQLDARPEHERTALPTPEPGAVVRFKYRGSLAKGFKSTVKDRALFDASEFDIDAFVESDVIFTMARVRGVRVTRGEVWANKSRIDELGAIEEAMRQAVRDIAGLKEEDGGFSIKVRTTGRVKELLRDPDEKHIVIFPRATP